MAKYVETINILPAKPSNPAPLIHSAGEYWAVIYQVTGNLILQPGRSNAVICPGIVKAQEYRHLIKGPQNIIWRKGMSNENGIIFQGVGDIQGTNTCFFIHRHKVPQDAKVTYYRIVCNIWPQKKETHRVRLTLGGYILTFDVPVSIPTSDRTISKLHWNSVISTPGSK